MQVEVVFLPDNKRVKVRRGTTLLSASRSAKVSVRTRCGGLAACLMCKVSVPDQAGVEPPNHNERLKLGSLLDENIRLSCQAKVCGDVTVIIPEDPLKAAIRRQLEHQHDDDELF
jgi:2Fe-2S ferredoxin